MCLSRPFRNPVWGSAILLVLWAAVQVGQIHADDIITEVEGKKVEQSGTVKHENDKLLILETSTGEWLRIAQDIVKERVASTPPALLKPEELGEALREKFKRYPHLRIKVTPDVIAVLILEAELAKEDDERADKVLAQMTKSYDQAANAVQQFAKNKVPQKKPLLPAVVIVCESDAVAEKRYDEDLELLQGVSFLLSSGWYDPVTNWATFSLADVLGENGTVADVLIWQQLFHTGMLQRQAPVPLWFLQGVAVGFDWTKNKIDPDHLKLSSVAFPGLQEGELSNWDKLACDYEYYESEGELDFGQFRDQAWALHWYLISKNKAAYARYWKTMSNLSPLDDYSTEKALADFKKAFAKNPEAFKPPFKKVFETASRNPPPEIEPTEIFIPFKDDYGFIKLIWLDEAVQNNEVRMDGKLTNISPLRARSFCVGFETNWGKSAVWFVDNLEPSKTVELKVLRATDPPEDKAEKKDKAVKKPAQEGEHEVSDYWIKSALPDSPKAAKWRKGEFSEVEDE